MRVGGSTYSSNSTVPRVNNRELGLQRRKTKSCGGALIAFFCQPATFPSKRRSQGGQLLSGTSRAKVVSNRTIQEGVGGAGGQDSYCRSNPMRRHTDIKIKTRMNELYTHDRQTLLPI